MNDLDNELRSVARALVDGAPAPPPFPSASVNALPSTRHLARRFAVAAAGVGALVAIAGAVLVIASDDATRVVASHGDDTTRPSATRSYACGPEPALRVTVPAAIGGPTDGPAPGTPPLRERQRAIHWTTADGSVELRWPGRTQPLYDDGAAVISTLAAGESVSAGRSEIDVAPAPTATDPATTFDPDVVVESREAAASAPTAPCDLLELTVVTKDGRWHGGLRALVSNGEFGMPAERVDLQPRIIERRSVAAAPHVAIRCQGSDQYGTPPNRTGGADRSKHGPQPADVLLGYLAAMPGAPPSGYVEMVEPDGSITYGADLSGIGWTTLVFLARDGDSWYLEGWTSSGC